MFLLGATVGPAVDGIHGQVHLLTYDRAPISIGSLHTSVWVFVLLGAFYATFGALFVSLDSLALSRPGRAADLTRRAVERVNIPYAALVLGVVALLHELSSVLYANGVSYGQISAVLACTAVMTWLLFDQTPQGLGLAVLCGLGAPASELLLMKVWGVWHYAQPDLIVAGVGLPSWVAWCYFFYTPWLANAARLIWKQL